MQAFQRILVGLDLARDGRYVSSELTEPNHQALDHASWLARNTSARVSLMYVLDRRAMHLSYDRQILLADGESYKKVVDEAREVLGRFAAEIAATGVAVDYEVVFGRGWLELIRKVLRDGHDLVIVGTRHCGAFRSLIFGNTALKLMRKCPCPVWVTRPSRGARIGPIAVAHDLSEVGGRAMELGGSLALMHASALHVVHALEGRMSDPLAARLRAEKMIRQQLEQLGAEEIAQVHILDAPPEEAILTQIEHRGIDLLVMGTITQSRIDGFFVGSTAERLLPFLPCSVLVVKPADFRTPVRPQADEPPDDAPPAE